MALQMNKADMAAAQLLLPVVNVEANGPPPARLVPGARAARKPRRARNPLPPTVEPAQPELAVAAATVDVDEAPMPATEIISTTADVTAGYEAPRGAFGQWLLRQTAHRQDWIAGIAKAAKADPRFPRAGTVEDVRKHLSGMGAEGDMFEALEDAERAWLRS
jgi:hypothetical protein